MNFWERVTGSDLTREYRGFEARAAMLPAGHRAAWEEVTVHLLPYGSFTGRNLMPILDGVLGAAGGDRGRWPGRPRGAGRRHPGVLCGGGGWRGSQELPRPLA